MKIKTEHHNDARQDFKFKETTAILKTHLQPAHAANFQTENP